MRGPEGAPVQQCTGATRHVLEPLVEGQGEVAGLLHGPLAGGVGGDSAKMHPAGAMLDEYQDIQSSQQHSVHVQEVDRDDPGGLGVQELPPARTRAARCWIDAGSTQDLPHGGGRDCHAELCEFAVDPAVSPTDSPTADSPSPGGRQAGRCWGSSAGALACAACSCRTSSPPVCGARPAVSLASRGRLRPSACAVQAAPARRTRPGRPARTAPGRRAAAVPRSRAGAPAAQRPSPGRCGRPGRPGRAPGT